MVKFPRAIFAPFAAALICLASPTFAATTKTEPPTKETPAKSPPKASPSPPSSTVATSGEPITIELNKLEQRHKACRAFVVLGNPDGPDLSDLKLDLILFGPDQVIQRRVAVSLAPLPKGKTMVKLFDIDGQDCNKIGSVLINEVIACSSSKGPVPSCEARLTPSSRANAKLFK